MDGRGRKGRKTRGQHAPPPLYPIPPPRKILGAIYYPWANFPCVFSQKMICQFLFFLKVILPNSIGYNYFTLKVAKILYKIYTILRNLNIFFKILPNVL
jgi:hypothetical protein